MASPGGQSSEPRAGGKVSADNRSGFSKGLMGHVNPCDGKRRSCVCAFELMATSQEPFEVWLRELLLDTYKLDLPEPTGPPPEQVLYWSADESLG
jgi:hypothetical protein